MDLKGAVTHSDPSMKAPKSLGTVVIKLGTSSIVDETTKKPLLSILTLIVETAVKLREDGHKVVIVSSGAIGVGLRRMDIAVRPKKHMSKLQALAAIGQCRLMSLWDSLFTQLRQPIAQILLTRNDIADRSRYLNAQNTVMELLDMGVIPIVNENDTLAVSEIKFGDNDTLSAITAAMVHAEMLFLMTDVDLSSAGSSLGTGGMFTKIVAARLATSAGVTTIIARASNPGNILNIVKWIEANPAATSSRISVNDHTDSFMPRNESGIQPPLHTRFLPSTDPIRDRSFWILHGLKPHGTVYIDQGAYQALLDKAGLLPVGVVDVEGHFAQQEAVRIVVVEKKLSTPTPDGKYWEGSTNEVGRALVNYSSAEIARIKGHQSTDIKDLLGYADSEYVVHRAQISFFRRESRPVSPTMEMEPITRGIGSYEVTH
ncbi:glutamate 5-kinase [Pyricularia oryzae Y34]|uniref:Glutamate 5-kinase n=1 Tax=Pyricularia oryzae (strain Y34) TaxID=1143189 RepID=A0AA97PPV4_PYRO3|nr:glutamate 5-kinase [Pyricularia oryzae Y34]